MALEVISNTPNGDIRDRFLESIIPINYLVVDGNDTFFVNLGSTGQIQESNSLAEFASVSLQFQMGGMDAADGVIGLMQSNELSNIQNSLTDIPALNDTIDAGSSFITLEASNWIGKIIGFRLTVNSLTLGEIMQAKLIAKLI